jgi:hypothetical protein
MITSCNEKNYTTVPMVDNTPYPIPYQSFPLTTCLSKCQVVSGPDLWGFPKPWGYHNLWMVMENPTLWLCQNSY